jgi:peptidoglycan-N-acetylglucosamine deacetylase
LPSGLFGPKESEIRFWGAVRHMRATIFACCLLAIAGGSAVAAECPGNPDALGTSRTLVIDPTEHPLIGTFNYRESLPLEDHEVVLTFDDGPLPPHTGRVLDILASECVKATFFMVGRMARAYPDMVKRIYAEGHTIGTHSQNHPFTFARMPVDKAAREIEDGFDSVRATLDDPKGVSDFFRIPGLLRQDSVELYLTGQGYQTWSVDFVADDWRHINDKEIVRRAISRIEARGKGILLLHDIHKMTALALPPLLRELKARGYRIVHVVEATPERPKTASLPEDWIARPERPSYWPPAEVASLAMPKPVLEAPNPHNFGVADSSGRYPQTIPDRLRGGDRDVPLPSIVLWPHSVMLVALSPAQMLPVPAADEFRYTRVWKPRSLMRSVRKPLVIRRKPPTPATAAVGSMSPLRASAVSPAPPRTAVSHKPPRAAGSPRHAKPAVSLAPPPAPTPAAAGPAPAAATPVASEGTARTDPVLRPPRPIGNETQPTNAAADSGSPQVGMR